MWINTEIKRMNSTISQLLELNIHSTIAIIISKSKATQNPFNAFCVLENHLKVLY